MRAWKDMPVLVLKGTPKERGRVHGEALKVEIREYITRWKHDLQESTGIDPDQYLEQFLGATDLLAAVKTWTPELLEEVRGIAEGCGVDFKTIFALQLPDEEWWYRGEKGFQPFNPTLEHCSAFAVFGQPDYPSLVAQNLDLPDYYDGHQVLLHIKDPSSPVEALVFTTAGLIAMNGLNNHAVGICCNALLQLNHATDGLPVAFVHRGVLAQPTLDSAIGFLHRVKHASGQNYIVGDPNRIVAYECSANQVSQFVPNKAAGRLYHTNHPLANQDLCKDSQAQDTVRSSVETQQRGLSNSELRFQSLESRLIDATKPVTVDIAMSILGSHDSPEHPICRHKKPEGGAMTIGCLIMLLSQPAQLYVAPGPPCLTELRAFTF